MAARARIRATPRALETQVTAPQKTPAEVAEELAVKVYLANKLMNSSKKNHDTLRTELYAHMKTHSISPFNTEGRTDEGKLVSVDVSFGSSSSVSVDIEKLRKLVDQKTFMSIVSASKTKVEEVAGTGIAAQCTTTVVGTENVIVKAAK